MSASSSTEESLVVRRRLRRDLRRTAPAVGVFDGERCELLAQLCHPLTPGTFLKRLWRRRCMVVHGGSRRFHALKREQLHNLSLPKLLAESPSEEISVWFTTSSGGNESVKVTDHGAALGCHRAGGSLYFRAPEELSQFLVSALSQQVGLSFGALYPEGAPRSEVETFVSRQGHVTNWHFDFMENFTLQLSGTKRWRLKRSVWPCRCEAARPCGGGARTLPALPPSSKQASRAARQRWCGCLQRATGRRVLR